MVGISTHFGQSEAQRKRKSEILKDFGTTDTKPVRTPKQNSTIAGIVDEFRPKRTKPQAPTSGKTQQEAKQGILEQFRQLIGRQPSAEQKAEQAKLVDEYRSPDFGKEKPAGGKSNPFKRRFKDGGGNNVLLKRNPNSEVTDKIPADPSIGNVKLNRKNNIDFSLLKEDGGVTWQPKIDKGAKVEVDHMGQIKITKQGDNTLPKGDKANSSDWEVHPDGKVTQNGEEVSLSHLKISLPIPEKK